MFSSPFTLAAYGRDTNGTNVLTPSACVVFGIGQRDGYGEVLSLSKSEPMGDQGGEDEMEAGGLGQGAGVAVARDEGDVGVPAVLCSQGIGEASFAIFLHWPKGRVR